MSGTRRARAAQPALVSTMAALAAGLAALTWALPAVGQTADPVVLLDRTGTAAGEQILVTGGGWPAASTVLVELCGQGGLRGSADCDVAHQAIAAVGASGTFTTVLAVGTPPSPCPCVVKAADQSSGLAATAPIAVQGVATVPIGPSTVDLPDRRIEVTSLELRGGGWTEWFGVPATRTLAVTLVNTGAVGIDEPEVAIAWGPGEHPTGLASGPPPSVGRMEPGESRTIEVQLPATGFAFGERNAVVEVQGLDETSAARTGVTTYPWALLAVALVAGQVVLLRIRNRVRRRLTPPASAPDAVDPSDAPDQPRAEEAVPVGPPLPGPDPTVADDDEVIDLRDPVVITPSENGEVGGEPSMEDAVIDAAVDWDERAAAAAAALRSVILRVEVLDLADPQPPEGDGGAAVTEIEALRAEVEALAAQLERLLDDQVEIRESLDLLVAEEPQPEPRDEIDQRIADACLAALRSGSGGHRVASNGHLVARGPR